MGSFLLHMRSAVFFEIQSKTKNNLQHFGCNSHDALGDFLVQGTVFGIVSGIVESLATKLVLEFIENCGAEHD
jgi:hypothetical protein